jgi:hypothetical protein
MGSTKNRGIRDHSVKRREKFQISHRRTGNLLRILAECKLAFMYSGFPQLNFLDHTKFPSPLSVNIFTIWGTSGRYKLF